MSLIVLVISKSEGNWKVFHVAPFGLLTALLGHKGETLGAITTLSSTPPFFCLFPISACLTFYSQNCLSDFGVSAGQLGATMDEVASHCSTQGSSFKCLYFHEYILSLSSRFLAAFSPIGRCRPSSTFLPVNFWLLRCPK